MTSRVAGITYNDGDYNWAGAVRNAVRNAALYLYAQEQRIINQPLQPVLEAFGKNTRLLWLLYDEDPLEKCWRISGFDLTVLQCFPADYYSI